MSTIGRSNMQNSDNFIQTVQIPAQKRKVIHWNNKRPFEGALDQYVKLLNDAILNAKNTLNENVKYIYAKVHLNLFDQITVICQDEDNNQIEKKYYVHEAHYGPLQTDSQFGKFSMQNFYNRDTEIYSKIGSQYPHFRYVQVELLKEGLYIVDNSVVYIDVDDKMRYHQNIILMRRKPSHPLRLPHGYSFIPNLGPVEKTVYEVNFPSF